MGYITNRVMTIYWKKTIYMNGKLQKNLTGKKTFKGFFKSKGRKFRYQETTTFWATD